jgi:hypothetical protein
MVQTCELLGSCKAISSMQEVRNNPSIMLIKGLMDFDSVLIDTQGPHLWNWSNSSYFKLRISWMSSQILYPQIVKFKAAKQYTRGNIV